MDGVVVHATVGSAEEAEAKVGKLKLAFIGDKDVIWLKIAMDNAKLMKALKGFDNLDSIDSGIFLIKTANIVKKRVEIAAGKILHDKIEIVDTND